MSLEIAQRPVPRRGRQHLLLVAPEGLAPELVGPLMCAGITPFSPLKRLAKPGGKVGVTTGMMAFVANDDELAAVLGHEVAHVMANHAAERYSQSALAQVGASLVIGSRLVPTNVCGAAGNNRQGA